MALPVLAVQLLGNFRIVYDDAQIHSVNTPRLQSLLAYLILHADSTHARQRLAFLLWSDTAESHAHNNFRQLWRRLRQALPDPDRFLLTEPTIVGWKMDPGQVVDVQLFESALRQAEAAKRHGDSHALRQALERAVSLYPSDLLPDCYDEWITPERDRLRQHFHDACQELLRLLEAQREYAAALQVAQHFLRLDPLNEATYASLIRLHVLTDDQGAARRAYQTAVETLQRELGVEPDDALRSTYERLLNAPRTISLLGADDSSRAPLKIIGRQAEWQQLQTAWRRAAKGDAHFVLITGEAGIGKSRLAEELFNWATRLSYAAAYTRSYAAEGRLTLAPVTEWLRSDALRPHLANLAPVWLTEIARLLPELLGEHPALARPEPITEYGMRPRFFEALARAVFAAPQPLLLWIDDLQWCDSETLEWVRFLLRFDPRRALLILGTARSEESPPDHALPGLARQLQTEGKLVALELSPLDAAETAKLASQIAGHELDMTAAPQLFRETEGNPLFIVETVRAGIAGETAQELQSRDAGESRILPARVHAVIAGRLAQLSPDARRVAEIAAAAGRAFPLELVLGSGQQDEEQVISALNELWQRRIVREQSPNSYDFTHDKLREVAYTETPAPHRRVFHRRIAQALEALNAENLDAVSAQIAAQYDQAGLAERAIPYYQRAGVLAASVFANQDALYLLTRGLELLAQLPPGPKRDAQELDLQLTLSAIYTITRGWASPEVERVLNRAGVLTDRVGDLALRADILSRLASVYHVRPELAKAVEIQTEMETLFVQIQGSVPPFVAAQRPIPTFFFGNFIQAREQAEASVFVQDAKQAPRGQGSQARHYLVIGSVFGSHASWFLGYPRYAIERGTSAVQFSRKLAQPFNQAIALAYFAMLQEWSADSETFRAMAEETFAFTREYHVTYYHAWASLLLQFAVATEKPNAENLAQLRDSIRTLTDTGARLRLPYYFSLVARVCHQLGRLDEGLDALAQAFSEAQRNKEQWWDAELHRLRGELMLAQGKDPPEVELEFRHAIAIARAQHSKSLELRAATSLARLWHAQSRSIEATELLAPVYAWFTEGFDTPDLKTAHALIHG